MEADQKIDVSGTIEDIPPWTTSALRAQCRKQLRPGPRWPRLTGRFIGVAALLNADLGYKLRDDLRLGVEIFNLLDSEDSDIEYFYASRLAGEPAAGVEDIHFHPVEPRSARVTLSLSF